MRNDHKDHQHYEKNVDERDNVHVHGQSTLTANLHSHESPRIDCLREDSHTRRRKLLLPRFELGGDQANLVDACAAHDVDSASNVHEERFVVALDESDLLGALFKDLLDARTKLIPTGIFLVNFHLAVLAYLHDDGFVFKLDVLLLIGIRLRHKRIEALRNQRRNHHENDDQHEQNIDQRNHIG